jgi:hypothetical protein
MRLQAIWKCGVTCRINLSAYASMFEAYLWRNFVHVRWKDECVKTRELQHSGINMMLEDRQKL